jgi:hypothetical protein
MAQRAEFPDAGAEGAQASVTTVAAAPIEPHGGSAMGARPGATCSRSSSSMTSRASLPSARPTLTSPTPSGSRPRTRDIRRRRDEASCSIRRSANRDSECPCGSEAYTPRHNSGRMPSRWPFPQCEPLVFLRRHARRFPHRSILPAGQRGPAVPPVGPRLFRVILLCSRTRSGEKPRAVVKREPVHLW